MNSNKFFKKGQSLPLNTIVIAIMVILVLLIIIVFFTTYLSKTGDDIERNDVSTCSINNPAVKTLGYDRVDYREEEYCDGTVISVIAKEEKTDKVCCGWKD